MRTVWITEVVEDLYDALEDAGVRDQYDVVPELPDGEYGRQLWHDLRLYTARLSWKGVQFLFLESEEQLTREIFEPDLVLDTTSDEEAVNAVVMAGTTVKLTRLAAMPDALDALAVLSDSLPPPRDFVLPVFGEVLRCRRCESILTKPAVRVDPSAVFANRRERLLPHQYGIHTDQRFVTSNAGLVRTLNVPALNDTYEGGFHPEDGPNQICARCMTLIAEYWWSDWFGRYVLLSPEVVELVPAASLTDVERAAVFACEGYGD